MLDLNNYRKSGGDIVEILTDIINNINYLENEINNLKKENK